MKVIAGHPNYYITTSGEIISKRTKKEKILKPHIDKFGYYRVGLMVSNTKSKTLRVHRLMMDTYGNPPPTDMVNPTVDHINGNKLDNRIENLQWLSNEENSFKASHPKIYLIEDKNGELIIVQNMKKWCRDNNLTYSNMLATYTHNFYHRGYKIASKFD
jgi:hypothetical protein